MRDDVLEAEGLARDHHQRQHHREAGEDGAGDEVGREDRGVPAGELRGREVERHDRVHGEHQRRREAGEDQVRLLVVLPVARRAAPAQREHAVDQLARRARSRGRAGWRGRGSGRRTRRAARRCSRSRPRRRPTSAGSGSSATCPSGSGSGTASTRSHGRPMWMPGKISAHDDGEDRHRLGGAVDRRAPLLAEEEEDRGDQRAGVADADPEDEVGDVPGPADRDC